MGSQARLANAQGRKRNIRNRHEISAQILMTGCIDAHLANGVTRIRYSTIPRELKLPHILVLRSTWRPSFRKMLFGGE